MNLYILLILAVIFIAVSVIITAYIRNFSIKNNLFDIPNDRSAHKIPVPNLGGIAIIIPLIFLIVTLFSQEMIGDEIGISMIIGLSLIAIVGLVDDCKNLSAFTRITIYIIASGASLYLIDGVKSISINEYNYYLGGVGYCLGVLFLVWLTNLYNFMDGVDGFAAIETICVSIFCCFLFYSLDNVPFLIIMLCLASTTVGFLYWNFAPAKIFMGDIGSCSIGFFFGLLAVYTGVNGIISISVWLVLLAPFISDATFTLVSRIFNSERWYVAHKSHAYQKLHQLGLSHKQLSLNLFIVNILLIWPLAYHANLHAKYELPIVILSYILMAAIWLLIQVKCKEITK